MYQKFIAVIIILFSFCAAFAQPFASDQDGYVADSAFRQLIKSRGYQLAGAFTIRGRMDSSLRYAHFLKNDTIGYIDNYGREATWESMFGHRVAATQTSEYNDNKSQDTKSRFSLFFKNRKCGTNDQYGKIGIPPIYDLILNGYADTVASVESGSKYGVLSLSGVQIIPLEYDEFPTINQKDGYIIVSKKGYRGVLSFNNKIIVPLKYSDVKPFHGLGFQVSLNNKVALFDLYGKQIIPLEYESIDDISGKLVIVALDNAHGVLNIQGEVVIPLKYESIKLISESLFSVASNGTTALFDVHGKQITPFIFNWVAFFQRKKPFTVFTINDKEGIKYGIIDTLGNIRVKPEYTNIEYNPDHKFFNVTTGTGLNQKVGLMDQQFKLVLPVIYSHIDHFEDDLTTRIYIKKDSLTKVGLIDTSGKILIKPKYDQIGYKWWNVTPVKLNGKWGAINKKENAVIPFKYDLISGLYFQHCFYVKYKGKAGMIDTTGKIIFPFTFDDFDYESAQRFIIYTLSKKQGIADLNGKMITEPVYDKIDQIQYKGDKNIVEVDDKYGIIDNYGKIIVPVIYKFISPPHHEEPLYETYTGIFEANLNDKDMIIDLYGNQYIYPSTHKHSLLYRFGY